MTEISKEYAAALFMLACEKNKQEEYGDALKMLQDAFCDTPEYVDFLASRSIPLSERHEAIEKAFSDKLPEDVVSYLLLMCEKGRVSYFVDSVLEYKSLLDASKQVSSAKVTSAVPLSESEKEKLLEKLEKVSKTSVNPEYFIDESLIGGVIVEIDGKVLDGSIKNRLRDIKEVING